LNITFIARLLVDITDELERIENNEELTTTSEDRDDTEKYGEIHVLSIEKCAMSFSDDSK